jgi:hypothetical protein
VISRPCPTLLAANAKAPTATLRPTLSRVGPALGCRRKRNGRWLPRRRPWQDTLWRAAAITPPPLPPQRIGAGSTNFLAMCGNGQLARTSATRVISRLRVRWGSITANSCAISWSSGVLLARRPAVMHVERIATSSRRMPAGNLAAYAWPEIHESNPALGDLGIDGVSRPSAGRGGAFGDAVENNGFPFRLTCACGGFKGSGFTANGDCTMVHRSPARELFFANGQTALFFPPVEYGQGFT